MGYFRSPLIVMLNMVKIMLAALVRRFYDVCKYMVSLGTAKQSSRINGIGALLCPSLTALVAAWIAFSRSSEALGLMIFLVLDHCAKVIFSKLPPGIALVNV